MSAQPAAGQGPDPPDPRRDIEPADRAARPDPRRDTEPADRAARPDPRRDTEPGHEAARPDPRRAVGRRGEDLALEHLRALGFETVARNHRTRHGEIDLIVCDREVLVFVEVKTRVLRARPGPGPAAALPLEGLRARQRVRLRRLVAAWLAETTDRPTARQIRVDAIGIVLDTERRLVRLDHVEGVL